MDFQQILKTSRLFYRDHNLDDWRHALPKKARVDRPEEVERAAERAGLTLGFAFPPCAVQLAELPQVIFETATKPASGLPDNQQYHGEPFLADSWTKTANGKVLQRDHDLSGRDEGSYLLLFAAAPCKSAWGRTGRQIRELFDARGWQGLTVPEYFVLQRWLAERHGDHRFFPEPEEENGVHSLWLVDSMDDAACSVALGKNGSINVQACPLTNRDSRRAALAAMVVPLVAAAQGE